MEYWIKRNQKAQQAITDKSIKEIEKQLGKYYADSMKKVIADFEATYNKLLVTIGEGKEPSPSVLYKLDSYWKMQAQLQRELQRLGDKTSNLLQKKFIKQYLDIYFAVAVPSAQAYTTIDEAIALQMINRIWVADGKSWSSRIWDNTSKLAETLNEQLIHCVVTGKKTTELKHLLQDRFNVAYNRADSLVRTELAHIQTESARKRYIDYGITEVEIYADKDERRCEICGGLHRKRFPINADIPIPAHPNCRCNILPVVE